MMTTISLCAALLVPAAIPAPASADLPTLTPAVASSFAKLALRCIDREYPNKLDHVMNDGSEVRSPSTLHPAFYGCFDWHSAVHAHWMLVRLLRTVPGLEGAAEIRAALDRHLTAEKLAGERAYFAQANRQSFERAYGWAWLLKLTAELQWDDPDAKRWAAAIAPLAATVAQRYREFFPKQEYPIRTGVHPNTAFALGFGWDYAVALHDAELRKMTEERAKAYFAQDQGYPAAWEPGGEDFFSPALMEADLMRRVLSRPAFGKWLHAFLPGLSRGKPRSLLYPVAVTDRSDPKLVHLDGLNLSRSWCLRAIADALPRSDKARGPLLAAAARHARDGLEHVASGDYVGEHWLASFAVYLLTEAAAPPATASAAE